MLNSRKFFFNSQCEHFPCHSTDDLAAFNCLFCFCPLYNLPEKCDGPGTILPSGKKDCSQCTLPHQPQYYDMIIAKLSE